MSPEEKNVLFPLTRQATVAFGFVTLREDGTPNDGLPRIVGSGITAAGGRVVLTAAHVIAEMIALGAKNEVLRHRAVPVLAVPGQAALSDPKEDGTQELIASHALLPFEELRHDVNPEGDIGVVIPPDALPAAVDLDFEHEPYEGDRVFACGWPYGTALNRSAVSSFVFGTVAAVLPHPVVRLTGRKEYVVQIPVNPGNSGGGVFDRETGHLIGIVSSRYQVRGIPTGLSTVVPTYHFKVRIEALLQEEEGRDAWR